MPIELPPKQERWLLFTLAFIQFTHIVDFMIMMPLGPQLIRVLQINAGEFGLLVSAYTFSACLSGIFASAWVERFERKKLLLILYTGFILATLACGLAQSYHQLLIARAMAGIFGGVLGSMVLAMVGDIIPVERRGRAMGIIMTAFSLSSIAGVPMGLFIAHHLGWRAPFVILSGLCLLMFAVAYRVIPSITQTKSTTGAFKKLKETLQVRQHQWLLLFTATLMFGIFCIIPYISVYFTTNVEVSESNLAWLYFAGGATTLISARVIGILTDRIGPKRMFRYLCFIGIIPMLAITHLPASPLWLVMIVMVCFMVFASGRAIPSMTLVSAAVNPEVRGSFMSINGAIQQLGSGLGDLVASHIAYKSPTGLLLHYNWVGYMAVVVSKLAVYLSTKIILPNKK